MLVEKIQAFKSAHSHDLNFVVNVIADSTYIANYTRNLGFDTFLCMCDLECTKINLYFISEDDSRQSITGTAISSDINDETSLRSRLYHLY